MRKNILLLIIFFICLMFPVVVFAQEGGQEFEGFDLVGYSEGGEKAWDLKGDTAQIQGSKIDITNVDANSYGTDNMNVTANQGLIDKESGNMVLSDDVVITTETGTKMLTDSLEWKKKKDLVTTDDKVTILRDGMTAIGQGIMARPGLNTAQLNSNVTVEYEDETKDPLEGMVTITCDGPMEVDYDKQSAIFNDSVVAIQADRKLMADRMEVYFDTDTSKIKEMLCIGNVLIVQGGNTSLSDRAVYKAGEQKIILSGRPKLLLQMDNKGDGDVPFGN